MRWIRWRRQLEAARQWRRAEQEQQAEHAAAIHRILAAGRARPAR